MEREYILSVLVQNNAGVLCRVSGLFGRRGYNITSLTVGETLDPRYSRMTIVLYGNEYILEQIKKQLAKLEEVEKIVEVEPSSAVFRELMLVKVWASAGSRAGIIEICNVFHATIADLSPTTAKMCIRDSRKHSLIGQQLAVVLPAQMPQENPPHASLCQLSRRRSRSFVGKVPLS